MASRRGVLATAAILGAITAASFAVWLFPQSFETSFVVSDFEAHLDGVKSIHAVIGEDLDAEFQRMLDGDIPPDEYIRMAETSSEQINSQIIRIVESDPVEDWQSSYTSYMESLRQSNSHIRETIVLANKIKSGAQEAELADALGALEKLKSRAAGLAAESDSSRP